ncbi:extracellular solute-binding protein [Cohnella nanjingensis]|uniref:Extracellular solute-binding protein n=1 Tax=Cohnella nanjingensis TaxID=1387779 RepID=A0A7X0RPH8_9BACL|nr:extracellular solute-binding protein [Cohnella nanjingensis]MBB6670020.1 extracellular solute-binding protein [Cohnella nanjingensis]
MFKKKMITLIAAAACLLAVTAGCSGKNEGSSPSPSAGASQPSKSSAQPSNSPAEGKADPLGKYDPPIEVTAVRQVNSALKFENGETIQDNAWTQHYANDLGIKLKYLWVVDNTQFEQKLNLMLASGELADIMPVPGVQMRQMNDAGQLEDLTEALDKYGSETTKAFMMKDGGTALNSATFKGKLVGLPLNPGSTDSAPLLWVRKDWLKKLNLPEPQTMEDVFKIAEAFATQDPDGNNKKDTYGLAVAKELYSDYGDLTGIFNGFHAYPTIWVKDASGNLVYGSIQPEMKQALAKLQELYKKGVIDREFGVKNHDALIQDFNAGKVGMYYGLHYSPLLFPDAKKKDPNLDLQAYRLPSIDGQPAKPQTKFNVAEYYVVRKGMTHPEAVVKLMNTYLEPRSREAFPVEKYAIKGDIEKWQYALVKGSNPTQNLDVYAKVTEAFKTNDTSKLDEHTPEPNTYKIVKSYYDGDVNGWGYAMIFGERGAQGILYDYNKNNGYQPTEFISAPSSIMAEKQATLSKLELETFTKIIMGESSVDTFDDFVANWKKLGGDEVTKEVADWKASK